MAAEKARGTDYQDLSVHHGPQHCPVRQKFLPPVAPSTLMLDLIVES
jgi:hypothetical protein